MIAGALPPGCTAAHVDGTVYGQPTAADLHRKALDAATHTVPCSEPICRLRRDDSCRVCHGTSLLPATEAEWQDYELTECMADLDEFVIQRLEKIEALEDLARPLRSSVMAMQLRLEHRKAKRAREAAHADAN
jgi:hypothetical protein